MSRFHYRPQTASIIASSTLGSSCDLSQKFEHFDQEQLCKPLFTSTKGSGTNLSSQVEAKSHHVRTPTSRSTLLKSCTFARFSRLQVSLSFTRRPCTALFSLSRSSSRHSGGRSSVSVESSAPMLSIGISGPCRHYLFTSSSSGVAPLEGMSAGFLRPGMCLQHAMGSRFRISEIVVDKSSIEKP